MAHGLKLYFMIGLPGETEADVAEIPVLARRMAAEFASGRAGAEVSVSVSTFVPKPRTPFQWLPMVPEAEIRAKLAMLRRAFVVRPRIEFSGVGPREAWRQGVISRGGRAVSGAIRLAVSDGLPWKAALKRSGIDAEAVAGSRYADDEVFPWEIVDIGVPRSALLASLAKAIEAAKARGAH